MVKLKKKRFLFLGNALAYIEKYPEWQFADFKDQPLLGWLIVLHGDSVTLR